MKEMLKLIGEKTGDELRIMLDDDGTYRFDIMDYDYGGTMTLGKADLIELRDWLVEHLRD